MRLKPIDQQVVVLVGSTSGIGLETAIHFARKGAKLVLAGRGQRDLDATLETVRSEGGDGITVEADVANWDQVQHIAERAVEMYGHIDTWAHVAGVSYYSKIEDMLPEEYRRVIEVNLNGPTYGIMAALPYLKREGRGAIIIVSSVDATMPVPYQSAYVAAKHGVQGMIDTLRIELKHDKAPISITNIIPATIDTPFFEKAKTRIGFEPNAAAPVYTPASVADAIVYAAEHPVREITVGGSAILYRVTRRISPRLHDSMILATAFEGQKSDILKSPENPSHLWDHLEGYHQTESKYPAMYSKTTWMQLHPVKTWLIAATVLLALPVGIYMLIRSRNRKRSIPRRVAMRISDLAMVSAAAGLVSKLSPRRRKTIRQRVVNRAIDMLPVNLFTRRQRSFPEKFASKVQDIMPKSIPFISRKSIPEKALDRVKEMAPKEIFFTQKKNFPEKIYTSAKETIQNGVASIRE